MLINEEDKIQYNLIEDISNSKVIGSVENIINFIEDNIKYNLEQGEDTEQLQRAVETLKKYDANDIIYIFENPMIGLDWGLIEYQ